MMPEPAAIINYEDLISTVEERAFTVTCGVDGGKPAPTVTWLVAANSDGSGVVRKFANAPAGSEPIISEEVEPSDAGPGIVNVRSNLRCTHFRPGPLEVSQAGPIRYSPRRDDDGKFLVCVAKHETVEGSMTAAAFLNVECTGGLSVAWSDW